MDDFSESSPDYDAYELYQPIDEYLSGIALSSGGSYLEHSVLYEKEQFEYVLKVLESANPIPSPAEPSMISLYSNAELTPMINSLLKVRLQYVDNE